MKSEMTQRSDFLRLVRELGVRVEAPYVLLHDGKSVRVDAYLPDFGGKNGMVILMDCFIDLNAFSSIADAAGLYFSALNGRAFTSERQVKETLDDWGYFGPENSRPEWYTGKPWS
jgi:hypothetical protein